MAGVMLRAVGLPSAAEPRPARALPARARASRAPSPVRRVGASTRAPFASPQPLSDSGPRVRSAVLLVSAGRRRRRHDAGAPRPRRRIACDRDVRRARRDGAARRRALGPFAARPPLARQGRGRQRAHDWVRADAAALRRTEWPRRGTWYAHARGGPSCLVHSASSHVVPGVTVIAVWFARSPRSCCVRAPPSTCPIRYARCVC